MLTTVANSVADDRTAPAGAGVPVWLDRLRQLGEAATEIAGIFRSSPEWLVIVFAWCVAAFAPYYWYMGEDSSWIDPTSIVFFQPFVPLAFAALLWREREGLSVMWQATSPSRRRGNPSLLLLGCLLLLVSHLVHVLTFAVIALLVIAAGVIYMAYGGRVLSECRRALLFALIMIPPPATAISSVSSFVSKNLVLLSMIFAKAFGRADIVTPGDALCIFDIQGHTVYARNGEAASAVLAGVIMLFWCVWNWRPIMDALMAMAISALTALVLYTLSLLLALVLPVSPATDHLIQPHPLLIAALSGAVTIALMTRVRPAMAIVSERTQAVGALSSRVERLTDRAVESVQYGVSRRVGGAGKRVNRATEKAIDAVFHAIGRVFSRRRKDRWR